MKSTNKDSVQQQPQVNGEVISPESPPLSQSHISDEPTYDTGVSSTSSINGNKVEYAIENNVENKSVEEVPKKPDIKKAKVNTKLYLFLIFLYVECKNNKTLGGDIKARLLLAGKHNFVFFFYLFS